MRASLVARASRSFVGACLYQIWLFGRDRQLWAVSVHDDGEFSVNYYLLQTQDNPNSSWIALVLPHPTNPEWALMLNAYSCAPAIGNCHTELYFTQDLGRSWRLAGSYVFYVAWGQSPSTIITVEYDPKSGDQTRKSPWVAFLVRSDDIGQTRAITRKWITGAYYSNNKLYWAQFVRCSPEQDRAAVPSTKFEHSFIYAPYCVWPCCRMRTVRLRPTSTSATMISRLQSSSTFTKLPMAMYALALSLTHTYEHAG